MKQTEYRKWNMSSEADKKKLIPTWGKGINYKCVIDNMEVFEAYLVQVRRAKRKGLTCFSSMAIIQYLRWETAVSDNDVTYKINNNLSPIFSRMAVAIFPSLEGYFQFRESSK